MDSNSRFTGGTWHRYKLGQAQFTKWLKQTADKITPSNTNVAATNGTRPETSRSTKKSITKAAKAGVESDVAVHWRELETLASSIVENAQPEDIPAAPINILRDVIGLRKKSAGFFRQTATDDDDDARMRNATHEHIIQVLERVLAKFEAVRARVQRSGRDAARSDGGLGVDVNDLSNMFEHLELHTSPSEDDAEEDAEDPPEKVPSSRKSAGKTKKNGKKKLQKGGKAKKQRGATLSTPASCGAGTDSSWIDDIDFGLGSEEQDDEFDYYMIIYCFFEDFNLIREYICERWCDYYFDRSVELNTLAVITNAAFELFHQMERELMLDMRRIGIRDRAMGQYEVMWKIMFTEVGMEHVEYGAYEGLTPEECEDKLYKDEWDWLASPASSAIHHLLHFIPPGKTAMMKQSHRACPVYGATTAPELKMFTDAVISELLFDVACVKALKENRGATDILPAESELMLGFQDALRSCDYSSAFAFSLQLYVDIRYILEDTVSHPFEQLQKTARKMERGLPQQIAWASGPRRDLRRPLRQRQKELERFMLNDVVREDKLPRYLSAGFAEEDIEEFSLLKIEPVWAGLLDFRAKLVASELGHELVRRSFLVQAAAYLYAAACAAAERYSAPEFFVWTDMDKFLGTYAADSALKRGILGHGSDPDPAAILKRFGALARTPPQDLSLDDAAAAAGQTDMFRWVVRIRQHLLLRYATEERCSQSFSMTGLIRQRLEPEMERFMDDGAEADVQGALREIGSDEPIAREEKRSPAEQHVGLRDQRAARRKALLAELSPIQQIQVLENTVNEHLNGLLSIDFMGLFSMSKTLLSMVGVSLGQVLGAKAGPGSFQKDTQPDALDQLVEVPRLLGECLVGDLFQDAKLLLSLVNDVNTVLR